MKKKKNKKGNKWIILVLILLTIAIWMGVNHFWEEPTNQPEETLKTYMAYILDKNYEGMYGLLSKESQSKIEKQTYLTRNQNIYEGIEISDLQINIVKTNKKQEKAEVIYQVTMQTIAGEIHFSNTSYLKKEENTYRLEWSSCDIFPELKENLKIRVETIQANRGKLLDREGTILAGKQTASQIGFVPKKMNSETKQDDIQKVANLLDLSIDTIQTSLNASYVKEDTFVPLRTIRKTEQNLKNQLLEIKGIKIIDTEERIYPLGEATSHLLGYIQGINQEELQEKKTQGYTEQSIIGKAGLEKLYEERLRAINGAEIYIIDEKGNKIKTLAKTEAKNGEDIKLTIDSTLQRELYEQYKEDKSASIVINPKTGEILALVSTPTFDSNDFSLGMTSHKWDILSQAEGKPMYNRFLASYVPGSSFKPITGAIGLNVKAFTAEEDFGASGKRWQKNETWKDFYITTLSTYPEKANLQNALIYSDNIYFAKVALKIGAETFAQSLQKMHFNEEIKTPVGTVRSSYSNTGKISTETALANSGYGQAEMLVNPIHMAMLYSSFVNEGNMVEVNIEYQENKDNTVKKERIMSNEVANTLKEDLIQVIENPNGTAHSAQIEGITLAGKTGTAEIKTSKEDTKGKEIGWYNTFIADEKEEKQLLIVTMVEEVEKKGGSHYVVDKTKVVLDKINVRE